MPPTLRRRATLAGLALAGLCAAAPVAAAAPQSATVLVKIDPAATPAERGAVADALDAVSARGLPRGWRAYRLDQAVTLAEARADLAGTSADQGVELDRRVTLQGAPSDPSWSSQWDMQIVGAAAAWDLTPGDPVVVAISDTGVDVAHPELAGRLWDNPGDVANGIDDDHNGKIDDLHGWDFRSNDASLYDGPTVDAHGTHVAGTIAALRGNGSGIAGLSSTARIMPVKFLEDATGGSLSAGISAIDYASRNGARIINASWGSSGYSQALCDAVQAAVDRGVLFVAAAGNDGNDESVGRLYPAACASPGIVSVAATTSTDGLASYSNRGATTVDLGAPGSGILSLAPGGALSTKSGTSMAAPHVTGVAAMLLGRHPELSVSRLKSLLMDTGEPVAALSGTTVSGRRLSASAALAAADVAGPDTTPPTAPSISSPTSAAVVRTVTVTWSASTDAGSGVAGYRVLIDGAQAADVPAGQLSATIPGVADGDHSVQVEARDAAGNAQNSGAVGFTADATPPEAFAITTPATVSGTTARIAWEAATDAAGIGHYRVAWAGGSVDVGGDATVLPFDVDVAGTLEFTVTAYDTPGNARTTTGSVTAVAPPAPPSDAPPADDVAHPAPAPARPRYRPAQHCARKVVRVKNRRVLVKRCVTLRVRL